MNIKFDLNPRHLWLVIAAYGVWFAVFSGFEEIAAGKYWKVISSLLLGLAVYIILEKIWEK